MNRLSIYLFGTFRAFRGDQRLDEWIGGKAGELLCYLLTHQSHSIAREVLASVLWADCTTDHSRKYLRKALWQLQRALCQGCNETRDRIVVVDSDQIWVSKDANIWVDTVEFEKAFASGMSFRSHELDSNSFELVRAGVDLYTADLLEGWYQDWCLCERERLQNMYLVMLDRLMSYCERHGAYDDGLEYGARVLRYDRAHEITYQRLMRLEVLAGDRSAALREYEHCVTALREELGVRPSESTSSLYKTICEDRSLSADVLSSPHGSNQAGDESRLERTLSRLHEVKASLSRLEGAVEESIQSVRDLLVSPVQQK